MTKVTLVKSQEAETLKMGPITIRVIEDGSNTDNRIGAITLLVAPKTPGPAQHWHRMHDETFLVTKGTVRFSTGDAHYDAKAGDYVVVPPKAVHTWSNPFDEEAEFYNSFTPAYYVDYLRMVAAAVKESGGKPATEEQQVAAMAQFATFLPGGEIEAEV